MARNDSITNRGTTSRGDTNSSETKDTLLEELESIKGLLLEHEDDIPVLHEVIESIEPLEQGAPRQSSLFTTNIPSGRVPPHHRRTAPTKASGENPFLPAHIRARLHGNRPPPGFDQDSDSDSATRHDAAEKSSSGSASDDTDPPNYGTPPKYDSREQLVNQLLSELQPLLEAQLRDKLNALSQEQLRHLIDAEANAPDQE